MTQGKYRMRRERQTKEEGLDKTMVGPDRWKRETAPSWGFSLDQFPEDRNVTCILCPPLTTEPGTEIRQVKTIFHVLLRPTSSRAERARSGWCTGNAQASLSLFVCLGKSMSPCGQTDYDVLSYHKTTHSNFYLSGS